MSALKEFWYKHRPLIYKVGLTLLLIPILIFGGGIIFSIVGFLFSVILGLILLVMLFAFVLAMWGYVDLKFGKLAPGEKKTRRYANKSETIVVESKVVNTKPKESETTKATDTVEHDTTKPPSS